MVSFKWWKVLAVLISVAFLVFYWFLNIQNWQLFCHSTLCSIRSDFLASKLRLNSSLVFYSDIFPFLFCCRTSTVVLWTGFQNRWSNKYLSRWVCVVNNFMPHFDTSKNRQSLFCVFCVFACCRLEHSWAGQLELCCQACSCMLKQTVRGLTNEQTWTTLLEPSMINQQRCSCMIEQDRTCCRGMTK